MSFIHTDTYILSVRQLYQAANATGQTRDFSNWKDSFIRIHGELDSQHKINIESLEETFRLSLGNDRENLFRLIFCLETYYSIILRMMAYKAVCCSSQYSEKIFTSTTFLEKGISNYDCKDYYNWFLAIPHFDDQLRRMFLEVNVPEDLIVGDSISNMFEQIFPKEIRHSLGEFYTPYWLAEHVVQTLTTSDAERSLRTYIDPACGSGTFLVAIINMFREASNNAVFSNICGIDINPLTVLAAKTNYLLYYSKAFAFHQDKTIVIPIYCADTIATNNNYNSLFHEGSSNDIVPQQEFDYVVGNPPWVNWEYLPKSYRQSHANLWQYYKLYSQKGLNAHFIKEDVSVLMTYVAIDHYLKVGGKLGFVIKETLFKSIKQGEGFRCFRIHPKNIDLNAYRVDDLSAVKPFKGAVTRTSLLYIQKGQKTVYPIDYYVWKPKTSKKSFHDVMNESLLPSFVDIERQKARPSVQGALNSGWITESTASMERSSHVLGTNPYTARTGVFTGGANGIFWLRIEGETPSTVMVANITERAKNKMKPVKAEVEKAFVFPFLTGNDLNFWSYSYSKYILCPHTAQTKMYPIHPSVLRDIPKTEAYLLSFKKELEERKGFTKMDEQIHANYYYALQRIGEYTFAKYKVCWRYISKSFTPAVVEYADDAFLGTKNIIGNEKIISVGLDDRDEAYYLCGIISSTIYRNTIESYMVGTQITPSIIKRLNIPRFDKNNKYQAEISRLCRKGHQAKDKEHYVKAIDQVVDQWFFNKAEAAG